MTPTQSSRKVSVLESIGAHFVLILAVGFALYPIPRSPRSSPSRSPSRAP